MFLWDLFYCLEWISQKYIVYLTLSHWIKATLNFFGSFSVLFIFLYSLYEKPYYSAYRFCLVIHSRCRCWI